MNLCSPYSENKILRILATMGDWIFAFFHLFLLIGVTAYAFFSLIQGNTFRFGLIIVCLIAYYFLVLHKPVKNEIERRRKERKNKEGTSAGE